MPQGGEAEQNNLPTTSFSLALHCVFVPTLGSRGPPVALLRTRINARGKEGQAAWPHLTLGSGREVYRGFGESHVSEREERVPSRARNSFRAEPCMCPNQGRDGGSPPPRPRAVFDGPTGAGMLSTSCHGKVPVPSGRHVIAPSPSDSALLEREQIVSVFQEQKRSSPAVQNGVASEGCAQDRRPTGTAGPSCSRGSPASTLRSHAR